MAEIKDIERFAEVEYCTGHYLSDNIIPIMDDVQTELNNKQAQELADYSTSLAGVLSTMAQAAHPGYDNSMDLLKVTGEWNSKTAEDYVQMCRDKVKSDPKVIHDLQVLTAEWRTALIAEIGQERYEAASKTLGADLAAAYVDYRIEQQMIDHMVERQMPKSAAEYIIRKGANESLFGLGRTLSRSPLEAEIQRQGDERYNPGTGEKAAGKAVSFAFDTISTGGFGSWSGLVKLAGVEVVFAGVEAYMDSKAPTDKSRTIEECISEGVFGSETNVFSTFKARAQWIHANDDENIARINGQLNNDVGTFNPLGYVSKGVSAVFKPLGTFIGNLKDKMVEAAQQQQAQQAQELAQQEQQSQNQTQSTENVAEPQEENTAHVEQNTQSQPTNQAGWGSLMGELGFDGLGDIGKNLGYVIAMLPDVIVGMMTGKTQSLHLRNNLVPIASVVAGLFIKNPILKLLLIGMGGMNLINKAGHEQIERHNNPDGIRFKQYPDEELNPRISKPVISGNALVANIDRTPCTITLPDNVVAAYQAGALPINTLANAVLAKHEANNRLAQENYDIAADQNQSRTISYK